MRNLLLRFLINAVAIAVITSGVLPGIRIEGNYIVTLALIAVVLGLINAFVRPILVFLSCPFIFFTFGLILFVINGLMFGAAALLTNWIGGENGRIVIDGLLWAIIGAVLITIINMVLERVLGVGDDVRVKRVQPVEVVVERQRDTLDEQFNAYVSQQIAPSAPPYVPPVPPPAQPPYIPPQHGQPPYIPPQQPPYIPPQPPPAQPPPPKTPRAPWE